MLDFQIRLKGDFNIYRKYYCGLDVHKTWIYAYIVITDANERTEYKESRFFAFTRGLNQLVDWLVQYSCSEVCMESARKYWIPVFNVLEKHIFVVLVHPKYTKPQKCNKTDRKDAKWICNLFICDMIKPSYIPSPDIRQLRDLFRYDTKLTYMVTGEKNHAQNCLTVSNLKLDDVFSDVFGKSFGSIIQHILAHPGETFDIAPFVDKRCKHPIEEVRVAVNSAICREQAVKLMECLAHIDKLQAHREQIRIEIMNHADKYAYPLELLRAVPGLLRKSDDRSRFDCRNLCGHFRVSCSEVSYLVGGLLSP